MGEVVWGGRGEKVGCERERLVDYVREQRECPSVVIKKDQSVRKRRVSDV